MDDIRQERPNEDLILRLKVTSAKKTEKCVI